MESDPSALNPLERMLIDEREGPTHLQLSLLESVTNNFSNDMLIGSGGFAVVYKGLLRNGTVAVKKLTQTLDLHEMKFQQEVNSLMRVKHKNIIRFLGYCSDTQGRVWKLGRQNIMAEERQRFLCFEFLQEGSLDKYISDASQGLDWRTRYHIIKGICEGLHYLHQENIVHLDLKPANILLTTDRCLMVPKIADFGLSKCFDEMQTRTVTSNVIGSLGYMAPEYYGGLVTLKSDIFSLGVMILEILTGQKGYQETDDVLQSWAARFGTLQGDIQLEPVRICLEIGIECIESNPAKRPAAQRIIDRLDELERTYGFIRSDVFTSSAENANRFPVLVRLTAPLQGTESSRAGLDLVAVLDVSKSIYGYRMKSMKQAMLFVINNLGLDDRLSIVEFSQKPLQLTELSVMSDANRQTARNMVEGLVRKKGSNMPLALDMATEILRQRVTEERRNRVGRIIFLSDGDDDGEIMNKNLSSEFPVQTFGLGANHDPNALRYIADKTMGLYSYVTQDLDKVKDAFAQSLGGLMSVTAVDVQINLQTLDGVTISSIESGGYGSAVSRDMNSGTILVPDLYAGEEKNFIVYLSVPENGVQNQVLTVSGSYRNPKVNKEARIQLEDCELVVLFSKDNKEAAKESDRTVRRDVASELIRLKLVETVLVNSLDGLQTAWEEIKGSEDGRSAPESALLILDEDVAEMQHQGKPFVFSWLTCHRWQRATTKGSPSTSLAFETEAMKKMIQKVVGAQP